MKRLKFSNLAFTVGITLLILLFTGVLTTINGQTSNPEAIKENTLELYEDQTSQIVLTYNAKGFKKALKVLVDKGIKSREISRIDISVPNEHMYFTVTPYLDEKITYAVRINGQEGILYSSTRIADVRKNIYDALKLHFHL